MRPIVLCVLATLIIPATAHAGDYTEPPLTRPLDGERYSESLAVAEDFWDATPACTVRFYAATDRELTSSTGEHAFAATRQTQTGDECPIWVGPAFDEPTYENRIDACGVIAHEIGHVLGYGHDPDPASVMYATGPALVYGCYRRFLPRGEGLRYRAEYGPLRWSQRPA